jgi:hypothetical protein
MDMWELSSDDRLKLEFYKLGVEPFDSNKKLRYLGRLWVAGELYKSSLGSSAGELVGASMALENHRHFALRKPRCLREKPDFLIPIGPFFDDWGKRVAQELSAEPLQEVVEALTHGWGRLPKTWGYERALQGILEVHPRIPVEVPRNSRSVHKAFKVSRERFEKLWATEAVRLMDEIPERA